MSSETHSKLRRPTSRARLWRWIVTLITYARCALVVFLMAIAWNLLCAFLWLNTKQWDYFVEGLEAASHLDETKLNKKDWKETFRSWTMFRREARAMCIDMSKTAKVDGPAVEVDVITLEGNAAKLLDYSSSPDRPLVVNFGSCT